MAAADATARRGDDLECVITLNCAHNRDVTVYYSVTNGNDHTAMSSTTINSGDTVPCDGAAKTRGATKTRWLRSSSMSGG